MGDEPWLTVDEQRAWRSYVAMRRTLDTHLARRMQQENDLSPSDFEILVNLSEALNGRMRAVDLGAATHWEKSRLSHHLQRMEKRGLVCRVAGEARYPEIAVTEAGLRAIQACAPANAARVRKLFVEVLGPERLAMLREAFDEVVLAVDEQDDENRCGFG